MDGAREAGDSCRALPNHRLPPAPRVWFNLPTRSWGWRPRLYAAVRSADS